MRMILPGKTHRQSVIKPPGEFNRRFIRVFVERIFIFGAHPRRQANLFDEFGGFDSEHPEEINDCRIQIVTRLHKERFFD